MNDVIDDLRKMLTVTLELPREVAVESLILAIGNVVNAAVLAEREACAKVAESSEPSCYWSKEGETIAAVIRERKP